MQTTAQVTQFNVSQPYFTGIPEDVVVNTFHCLFDVAGGTAPGVVDYGKAADRFKAFYDQCYSTTPKGSWLGGTATVKAYSLWLPPPHVPVFSGTRTIVGTSSGGKAPTETAICLSIKGTYVGGIPQARQRGRIFLGGLSDPCAAGTVGSFPEINSSVRTGLATACSTLLSGLLTDKWTWVILSTAQVAGSGQETFNVTGGWVDNTPDTQRRRGVKATSRTTW